MRVLKGPCYSGDTQQVSCHVAIPLDGDDHQVTLFYQVSPKYTLQVPISKISKFSNFPRDSLPSTIYWVYTLRYLPSLVSLC
jgi:hypothetical protein